MDFAVGLEYRAARPTYPQWGETAYLGRPLVWERVPLAESYRLRIGLTRGGSELLDTGPLGVTRRFVTGLPRRRTLFGTLSTVYADRILEHQFEFRAQPGEPTEAEFVEAALATTAAVRRMAGVGGAWPRTLLENVMRSAKRSVPICDDFAHALIQGLAQQNNPLESRSLGTCLLANSYDCHTLVALHRPSAGKWMLLDPTFGVSPRRSDGDWATLADLTKAARDEDWSGLRFVPLVNESLDYLVSYHIDYPLLFVSPLAANGRPLSANEPSVLRYYHEVRLPFRGILGVYAIRCREVGITPVLIDGVVTTVTCQGTDALSELRPASSIEAVPGHNVRAYRPRRFLF